jgi:hypothetical protein
MKSNVLIPIPDVERRRLITPSEDEDRKHDDAEKTQPSIKPEHMNKDSL